MKKQEIEIEEKYSKYEIARILGARALQLSMNAPLLLKIEKDELERIRYDPLEIAEIELRAGVLPITVKRPLPQKTEVEEQEDPKRETKEDLEERKIDRKIEQAEIREEMSVESEEELEEIEEENPKKDVEKEAVATEAIEDEEAVVI